MPTTKSPNDYPFSILDNLSKDLNETELKSRENRNYIWWELKRLVDENSQYIIMEAYANFTLFFSGIRN